MPRIPAPVIRNIPPPVVSTIEPIEPVTQAVAPPVVRGLEVPIINVPDPTIDYPVIDVPTQEEFDEAVRNGQQNNVDQGQDTRDLAPPVPEQPVVDVGGVEIPIPEPGPLVAAGSLAVVTTAVTLGSTIIFAQLKNAAEPFIRELVKKKKVKIKSVKPVLHFVASSSGSVDLIQYSAKGMTVLEASIDKLEQYLRDQVEIDSLWEYDNKIIIDEELGSQLTKEGKKRFKRYFIAPKVIAKKLSAKFSI